jgi:hypothetical protein
MLTHGSPGLADDRRGAFSIVLAGNQIESIICCSGRAVCAEAPDTDHPILRVSASAQLAGNCSSASRFTG